MRILALNSSASGDESVSRILVEDALSQIVSAVPDAQVTHRDLGSDPLPHLTPSNLAGVRADAVTVEEQAARALSDELVMELRNADLLVIGAPMYNFSIPSTLRAWFDHVLRPRVTFAYDERGPKGLIEGVRAIVIEARGGLYSEGSAKVLDFQEPYLRQLLGLMGVNDVTFIHAERIGFGPDARAEAIANAKTRIGEVVAQLGAPATTNLASPVRG